MEIKSYILRLRAKDKQIFLQIKNGIKKVETRAGTSKFIKIKKGDMLVFICGKSKFSRVVKNVKKFKTIEALFKFYRLKDIMPELATLKEAKERYYSFPGYQEKIKKFGLIAFEI